jgi:hypothetical protein
MFDYVMSHAYNSLLQRESVKTLDFELPLKKSGHKGFLNSIIKAKGKLHKFAHQFKSRDRATKISSPTPVMDAEPDLDDFIDCPLSAGSKQVTDTGLKRVADISVVDLIRDVNLNWSDVFDDSRDSSATVAQTASFNEINISRLKTVSGGIRIDFLIETITSDQKLKRKILAMLNCNQQAHPDLFGLNQSSEIFKGIQIHSPSRGEEIDSDDSQKIADCKSHSKLIISSFNLHPLERNQSEMGSQQDMPKRQSKGNFSLESLSPANQKQPCHGHSQSNPTFRKSFSGNYGIFSSIDFCSSDCMDLLEINRFASYNC